MVLKLCCYPPVCDKHDRRHRSPSISRYRFSCTDDEYAVLKSYLSPEVLDGTEIGWEEHAEVRWQPIMMLIMTRGADNLLILLFMMTFVNSVRYSLQLSTGWHDAAATIMPG